MKKRKEQNAATQTPETKCLHIVYRQSEQTLLKKAMGKQGR